jgi:hypothetical protein
VYARATCSWASSACGQIEAALQPGDAVVDVHVDQRHADVVERAALDLAVADGPGEADGLLAPGHCPVRVVRQHPQLRQVAVRHGQLAARRQRFERRPGLDGVPLGVGVAAQEPRQPRQPRQRIADAHGVTGGLTQFEHLGLGVHRGGELIGQVALVRQPLEQP